MARAPIRRSGPRSFGGGLLGRVPPVIIVYIATTALFSIVALAGGRNGFPLAEWCGLIPARVLRGELWRLFTWMFFELDSPMNLVFACLTYYWWGRELAERWGTTRFVVYTLGIAAIVGAITVGLSVLLPGFVLGGYASPWPLQDALIILWATYYPTRTINLYMVLPVTGRMLIVITLVGTLLYSLYVGFAFFVPHFIAEAFALAVTRMPSPQLWWLERKLRSVERRRRAAHLKAVPRDATSEPRHDGGHDDDKPDPPNGRWLN